MPGPWRGRCATCARLARVVAGVDPLDPTSADRDVPDFEGDIEAPIKNLSIGVPSRHHWDGLADDVRAALAASLDVFRGLGALIVDLETPDPKPLDALANIIILSEAAAIHRRWLKERPQDYTPLVRDRIQFGLSFPAARYVEALSLRSAQVNRYRDAVFDKVDVLHVPLLSRPVPSMADVEASLAGKPDLSFNLAANTRIFNYLGFPGLTVPCGFTDDGLPVAFQLVGPPFEEHRLFRAGHAFQSATNHHRAEPPVDIALLVPFTGTQILYIDTL